MSTVQTVSPFFSFGLRTDENGRCSLNNEQTTPCGAHYPPIKNRQIWEPQHPDVGFYPQAIQRVMELHHTFYGTQEEWMDLLCEEFPSHFVGNSGNFSHAIQQGLIGELDLVGKGQRKRKMYACNQTADHLNKLSRQWTRDILTNNHGQLLGTPAEKNRFLEDWMHNFKKSDEWWNANNVDWTKTIF